MDFESKAAGAVKAKLYGRWEQALMALAPSLAEAIEKKGRHVGCPVHRGKTNRNFRAFDNVNETGGVVCNSCGTFANGLLTLEWINGWSQEQTIQACFDFIDSGVITASSTTHRSDQDDSAERHARTEQLLARYTSLFGQAYPLFRNGQVVAEAEKAFRYFGSRGLADSLEVFNHPMSQVRFHPELPYYNEHNELVDRMPALVSRVSNAHDNLVTLHRTYLRSDGRGKADVPNAKKVMATAPNRPWLSKSGIWVGDRNASRISVAEGLETALAVSAGIRHTQPVVSTVNAVGMARFVWPSSVKEITIWADNDASGTGIDAAVELHDRAMASGVTALIKVPSREDSARSRDWLDVLNERCKRTA